MKNKTKAAIALAALVGIAAAAMFVPRSDAGQPGTPTVLVVRPTPVSLGIDVVGKAECDEAVPVLAPFDAVVLEKRVAEGERVSKGQPLLLLSSAEIRTRQEEQLAEKLRADAQLERLAGWDSSPESRKAARAVALAATDVEDSRRKVAEAEALYADGIIPKMELDGSRQQLRSAEANLLSQQEDLAALRERQGGKERRIAELQAKMADAKYRQLAQLAGRALLTAPVDGIVTRVPAPGEVSTDLTAARVTKDQPLLKILNLDSLVIAALVNESEVAQVHAGQAVDIAHPATGWQATGKVLRVSSLPTAASRDTAVPKFEVRIALPGNAAGLRVGATVDLKILTYRNAGAIVVPATALQSAAGGTAVEIIDEKEQRRRVPVAVKRTVADGVEIEGIQAGTRVVIK
jgi:multidrug efflux pump subunit AcrA (membrane-fusion protein)